MAFEKIKMTESQLIRIVFKGDPNLYKAFKIFQKHKIGMTSYDRMIMAVKVNVEVVDTPVITPKDFSVPASSVL